MRPRLFETAQCELEEISVLLQRAHGRPEAKPRRRLKFWPAFSFGPILYILGLPLLAGVLLHQLSNEPWQTQIHPNVAVVDPQPLATAAANDPAMIAEFNRNKEWYRRHPVEAPRAVPRAALVSLGTPSVQTTPVHWGDSFWANMPDGRWVVATAVGKANSPEELPLTGNQIGDARWIGQHCFVWLNPIGQTSPTWIDP